jgi:hypothetical protein
MINKTAVDFTFEKLANQGLLVTKDYKNLVAYRESKEMEKEQIINDYCNGRMSAISHEIIPYEQYYNETYGGNK